MDLAQLEATTHELLDSLGARIPDQTREFVRSMLWAGEEGLAVDELVGFLVQERAAVSPRQRDLVCALLYAFDVDGHDEEFQHLPSLSEIERPDRRRCAAVNSGCWLRQLHPIRPHLKGPPVFVSRFVLTHVRVFAEGDALRVELWEHPKPARQSLGRIERLLSWGRRPPQPSPDARARLLASSTL